MQTKCQIEEKKPLYDSYHSPCEADRHVISVLFCFMNVLRITRGSQTSALESVASTKTIGFNHYPPHTFPSMHWAEGRGDICTGLP